MIRLTSGRFEELADRDGFLVAYPQGVGNSWNDGRVDLRSEASRRGIDDVAFIRALIEALSRRERIDVRRIFVAGMSNGGMMAMRLACGLPDRLRGAAAVAASLSKDASESCRNPSGVSVVLIDGTADPIVPYDGGAVSVLWSRRGDVIGAPKTAQLWSRKCGCDGRTETDLPTPVADGTRVRKIEYEKCASGARVLLYRIDGGGHAWPGGRSYLTERLIGKTSGNLSACDAVWETFSALR